MNRNDPKLSNFKKLKNFKGKNIKSAQPKDLKERREYYRHETDMAAGFRKEETSDFSPAKIVNISIVGAYLRTEKPLRAGKQIELSFQLPGKTKPTINCLAKVIWTAKFEGYHGGIKFINIKRMDQYRITGFISNALRKMGSEKKLSQNVGGIKAVRTVNIKKIIK